LIPICYYIFLIYQFAHRKSGSFNKKFFNFGLAKNKKNKIITNIIQNLCPFMQNRGFILAIESSCDDTAAAVYTTIKVLSNVVANQLIHAHMVVLCRN
jgi:hypothetical protein